MPDNTQATGQGPNGEKHKVAADNYAIRQVRHSWEVHDLDNFMGWCISKHDSERDAQAAIRLYRERDAEKDLRRKLENRIANLYIIIGILVFCIIIDHGWLR